MTQSNPITEKHLNIDRDYTQPFADVRQRAQDDYINRKRRSKKQKGVKLPEFKVGQKVVVKWGDGYYWLVDIVDFGEKNWGGFNYYGIVTKVSDKKFKDKIGRFTTFDEDRTWSSMGIPAKCSADDIRWWEGTIDAQNK